MALCANTIRGARVTAAAPVAASMRWRRDMDDMCLSCHGTVDKAQRAKGAMSYETDLGPVSINDFVKLRRNRAWLAGAFRRAWHELGSPQPENANREAENARNDGRIPRASA